MKRNVGESQLTITRENRIFFLQNKRHMVYCVTRCMERSQRCPLNAKHLSILDVILSFIRLVLVHRRLGADRQQIIQTPNMVAMPVRQKCLVHCGVFLGQHGFEICRPRRFAFPCVEEDPLMTSANEVCVCACKNIIQRAGGLGT